MPEPTSMFEKAIELHQEGHLAEAEELYRGILQQEPAHADALHFLGVIEHQRRRHEEAVRLIGEALRLNPEDASAHVNLGVALRELKRPEEALVSFDRALAIEPDLTEAFYNRGLALLDLKRPEDALASFDAALEAETDLAELLNNRGNALRDLKRPEEALESFDRALALEPELVEALINRGIALRDLKRHEEAIESYDRALAIVPDFEAAHYNRGNALRALVRSDEALESYDRVLANNPDHVEALSNRGNALRDLNRPEEALASYDRALAVDPDQVEVLNNRGNTLRALMRPEEALASFDRALAIDPDDIGVLNNRANALLDLKCSDEALECYGQALALRPDDAEILYNRGNAFMSLHRYEQAAIDFERLLRIDPHLGYAAGKLLHSRMHCCAWESFDADVERVATAVHSGRRGAVPFELLAVARSPAEQLRCAQIWVRDRYERSSSPIWQGERYGHDRIRVAYLTADFREQATSLLTAGLFERHDKRRFETVAISFGADTQDDMRRRLKSAFDDFIDVRDKGDREIGTLLRKLEIDISVDLMGFYGNSRTGIFALRPTPIQVNYLGFPGTMGADYMDYILADRFVLPEKDRQHYTEAVVYLPESYQVNDSSRHIGDRSPSRAEVGLPETGFVYCSFNNNYKITPTMFDVWMRLLHQVDGSVLWLLQGNAAVARNLRLEAEKRGIAAERLVFAPHAKIADHLARHRLADLSLDTLPCNAHTTASDALWAGLPVVTCFGSTFAGRVAGSLLNAVGLPELITDSLEEYEALALRLASDRDTLAAIKAKLARNRDTCPLFNTDRFCRHIESAYVTMWERFQRGEPPEGFSVAPDSTPRHHS